MIGIAPICLYCQWFRDGFVCNAFPDGIPDDILRGESFHKKPREGDHGFQFRLAGGIPLPAEYIDPAKD